MDSSFREFLAHHSTYRHSYEQLANADAMLARSARTVVEVYGEEVGDIAESILGWTALHYGSDFVAKYVKRVRQLSRLQERFQAAPSSINLGDPTATIDRESYDLALLLSYIFSNHRYEILRALRQFLEFVGAPYGRLASVGIGTGYELHVIAKVLPSWTIEGYDTDEEATQHAACLLRHLSPCHNLHVGKLFPLDAVVDSFRHRFSVIVMCELLEHLEDPLGALKSAREYLTADGHMFVTMAINIAQEDHVYLYSSVAGCREQLAQANLSIIREWLIPVAIHPSTLRRREGLSRGNYAAIVKGSRE